MKKCIISTCIALLSLVSLSQAQGFTISGTKLLDANGNNFIMKGINVPLAWFVNNVNSNITSIKNKTGANCFRIVVTTNTADNAWQTCVTKCIENKIIPMVELHDVTGSNNTNDLQKMASWWASKASFLTRSDISKYILVNIANEWGNWYMSSPSNDPKQTVWRDAYISAIKTLRDAGINTTIVVDAPGYGQDNKASTIINYGPAVQTGDPKHNILFSVHMYCEWKVGGSSSVTSHLPAIKAAGLPVIVGEFGYQHSEGNSDCNIDEVQILNTCQSNGIGWLAWSWKGNGSPVQYLDLSSDWAGNSLSNWGNTIVNGTNGTKTAITASVFSPPTEVSRNISHSNNVFNFTLQSVNRTVSLQIDGFKNKTHLQLFDPYGRLMEEKTLIDQRSFTFHNVIAHGVYLVKLTNAQKSVIRNVVVK